VFCNTQVTFDTSVANARSEAAISINPRNLSWERRSGSRTRTCTNSRSRHMHRPMAASPGSKPRPFGLESGWTGISDPTLAWDKGGNLWLPGLAFAPGLNGALIGIAMYSSGDGGKTWSPPNLVHTRSGDGKQ
jgi:hypothetical protein